MVAKGFRFGRVPVIFALAIAIANLAGTALAQNSPELQITAPSGGSTAVPGQTLTIVVQSAAGVSFPNGVAIIASDPLGAAGPVTTLPYTFSLMIPANTIPGIYDLTALGIDSNGAQTASQPVTLRIEPASAPVKISVQPAQVVLTAIGSSMSLQVVATFPDNSTANVNESANMTYTPANPVVASVDSSGSISAVGVGSTSVDVKYAPGGGSLEVIVPVAVLPPIITTAPSTLAFGVMPVGSSSAPQTVTVTNSANFPVSFLGVSATGDFGETDHCVSKSPIAPNNSCSVQVMFSPTSTGPRTGSIRMDNNAQVVSTNIILSGIGSASSPTPTQTPTATQTATPTATATPTTTATPTATATPTPITVPVALKVTVAGLKNGAVNFGTVKVGKLAKRRFTLANTNRTHTPIQFLDGDGQGHPFIVNPAGNFGFLRGVQATNCPQPLPANKKCWLDVWFVPQDKINNPPKMATLTIFDNATNGPQRFTLMGTAK